MIASYIYVIALLTLTVHSSVYYNNTKCSQLPILTQPTSVIRRFDTFRSLTNTHTHSSMSPVY